MKIKGESGKAASRRNFQAFEQFAAERDRKDDWDKWCTQDMEHISPAKIARACKFGRSVFLQNPAVSALRRRIETKLKKRKVLGRVATQGLQEPTPQADATLCLKILASEIAGLEADISATQNILEEYNKRLNRMLKEGR